MNEQTKSKQLSVDEVWKKICDECQQYMNDKKPICTLKRKTPNFIMGVEASRIWRLSEKSKSGKASPIGKSLIKNIWRDLLLKGHTRGITSPPKHVLYFALALVNEFVPGVKAETDPVHLKWDQKKK